MTRRKAPVKPGHRPAAGFDALTGVWNRLGFVAAATPLFMSCQRRDTPVALAVFHFHTDGTTRTDANVTVDRTLISMVDLMRKAFRDCDIIGRVDTASLAVFLGDCTDEGLSAVEGLRSVTDRSTSGQALALAVGMARATPGGAFDDLLREARARAANLEHDMDPESASETPVAAAQPARQNLRFGGVPGSGTKAPTSGW